MTEKVYLYQLIEFVAEKTESGKKSIDCVPTTWVEFDVLVGQCYAKFMPPPYTAERKRLLKKMIVDAVDPLYDWPRYSVIIRGGAATYKEAAQRLERLTVEEYAYTTGCDEPQQIAKKITKSFAVQAERKKKEILDVMAVPTFQMNSMSQKSSSNYTTSSDESSESTLENANVAHRSKFETSQKSVQGQLQYSKHCESLDGKFHTKLDAKQRTSKNIYSRSISPIKSSPKRLQSSPNRSSPTYNVPHELEFEIDTHTESHDLPEPIQQIHAAPMQKINTKLASQINKNAVQKLHVVDNLAEYDMKLIVTELRNLRFEQRQTTTAINKMQETLDCILATDAVQSKHTNESFERKYKIQLPIPTYEEFVAFDKRLAEDKKYRTAFVQALSRKFDEAKSVTKNITVSLKRYLSRDVALLFNAQKKAEGEFVFKDTTFSNCLLEVIDEKSENQLIPPISDDKYLTHLGAVLSNVKDWGISRVRSAKNISS